MIQSALMDMLRDIKVGIRTQMPTTELATKQITQAMMENTVKGEKAVPTMQMITPEQLAEVYSMLPGASLGLGEQFMGLTKDFICGYMDIAQKQGLLENGLSDK